DAEVHADDDRKKRKEVEARNNLDSLIFQSEKMLKDNADKIPEASKEDVEAAIAEAKTKLDAGDVAVLTKAKEDLEQRFHKLAEELYKNTGAQGATAGGPDQGQDPNGGTKGGDDVVDAEYEEGSPT